MRQLLRKQQELLPLMYKYAPPPVSGRPNSPRAAHGLAGPPQSAQGPATALRPHTTQPGARTSFAPTTFADARDEHAARPATAWATARG